MTIRLQRAAVGQGMEPHGRIGMGAKVPRAPPTAVG